jgi:hypothetical protein
MEEIKDLYLKLLQKKYQKTIKSIPDYKLRELLDYAQNVNSFAWLKLNSLLDPDFQLYLDPEAPYNWPYPIHQEIKTEYRLKEYLTTSGIIIRLLENKFIDNKNLPLLPDCFRDKQYFLNILQIPSIEDLYIISEDGSYHLKDRKKAQLGALAFRLYELGKLKDFIKTTQDLAKVFCTFFNVRFDSKYEKSFQLSRTELYDFDFIK